MRLAQGISPPAGHQTALMKNQQVIARLHFIQQVGGPEHADVLLATQVANVLIERQPAGRIEADTGLVEQQQPWLMQQGAGDFHRRFKLLGALADGALGRGAEDFAKVVEVEAAGALFSSHGDIRRCGSKGGLRFWFRWSGFEK